MNIESLHEIPRKPVGSNVSNAHKVAGDHVNSTTVPAAQTSNRLNIRSEPLNDYRHHLADQEGPLIESGTILVSDTTSDEKQKRPAQKLRAHDLARRYQRFSSRSWLWECLSCVAVGALACAIIAVLAVYNREPLPQLPFSISLNTVVSLHATGLKADLIIPTAACELRAASKSCKN